MFLSYKVLHIPSAALTFLKIEEESSDLETLDMNKLVKGWFLINS